MITEVKIGQEVRSVNSKEMMCALQHSVASVSDLEA